MCAIALLAGVAPAAAQVPVPGLRVEAINAGSVLHVKNTWNQPLTGYLIELVGYPGSSYSLWREDIEKPVAPGEEIHIPIVNMTVGAAPEYVKLQAGVYADGTLCGIPEKAAQIVERRRYVLDMTRKLIQKLQEAAPGASRADLVAGLKQWGESLPPTGRPRRNSQEAINQAAGRELISSTCAKIESASVQAALAELRASEKALAQSKPSL